MFDAFLFIVWGYFLISLLSVVPIASAFSVGIPSLSPQQQPHPPCIEVPRMSVSEFTAYWQKIHSTQQEHKNSKHAEYYNHPLVTPILVTGALSPLQCEEICSQFIETAQNDTTSIFVELQRRQKTKNLKQIRSNSRRSSKRKESGRASGTLELRSYNVSLLQAIDTIMTQSNHDDAFWCFQEGLFEDHSVFEPIHNILQCVRQSLLQGTNHRIQGDNSPKVPSFTNWFDYFPKWAQSTDCVILSGVGSTSTLHRDPFEWTGTSICVEGTKIWRFIEPNPSVQRIDAMMESYRLPSVAWDVNTSISAGWQSDYSLYRNINPSSQNNRMDEEWSMIATRDEKYRDILIMAQSFDDLQPDYALRGSNWTTSNIYTTVQQEGDFLIIPSHYWHQTYTIMEPTVTISSQHCSDFDLYRVLNHIITTTNRTHSFNVDDLVDQLCSDDIHPKQGIQQFFKELEETLM